MGRKSKDKQPSSANASTAPPDRSILVECAHEKEISEVWEKRRSLKGTKILIKEYLPLEIERRGQVLAPVMLEARK